MGTSLVNNNNNDNSNIVTMPTTVESTADRLTDKDTKRQIDGHRHSDKCACMQHALFDSLRFQYHKFT